MKNFFLNITLCLFLLLANGCQPPVQKINHSETARELFTYRPGRGPFVSAHRGGPVDGYPENCIETFDYTIRRCCAIIECDIRSTKDNRIVMMHDHTLDRTTNGQGKVEDFTLDELKQLFLRDNEGHVTKFRIPTLEETLIWARNKAFLALDVKQDINYDTLIGIIRRNNAREYVSVITYSATESMNLYMKDTALSISASIRKIQDLERLIEYRVPPRCFSAFVGTAEPDQKLIDTLHSLGVTCILGTMGNLDKKAEARGDHVYTDLLKKGVDVLSTDRHFEADAVIKQFIAERQLKTRCINE